MNENLKMLLVSLVAFIIVLIFVNALDNQQCKTVEYQNLLTGPQTERVCEWEK
jgi:hypothetical protein